LVVERLLASPSASRLYDVNRISQQPAALGMLDSAVFGSLLDSEYRMLPSPFSDIPGEVLRVFTEEEHALAFLQGKLRLRERCTYREIEDQARRDASEGEARLRVPGVNDVWVNYGSRLMNPVYVLCTSLPTIDPQVRAKMGRYVVHVRDTSRLVAALQKAVEVSPLTDREVIGVDAGLVAYTQDEQIAYTPDSETRTRLTYFQKSKSFSEQCEWRFVVQMSGPLSNAPECLYLEIGSLEEFAELLPLDDAI
jgi:hypothetical protein